MMKVLIGCGGTGGHITPALAIADTVCQNRPGSRILFLGAIGGMEEELVSRAGYPIRLLPIQGLSRKLTFSNLKALRLARRAAVEAREIIGELSPDIVIGTGGYACYPALRAAISMGVPSAIHESNAYPGLTVRRLAGKVGRVWLNFDAAAGHLPKGASVLTVGAPLPRGYTVPTPLPLPAGRRQMVLSFGGSLGAREINRAMLSLMELERARLDIYHLHATGKREYEGVCAEFCARGLDRCENLKLVPFLHDMPRQMATATLVICRAGAMSIGELAALGKPAILIPSPNVVGNHQYQNAKALADVGAAVLIEEKDLLRGELCEKVFSLLRDSAARQSLSGAISRFHHPRANAELFFDLCKLCRGR